MTPTGEVVDLRSDTLTRPTAAMREAMRAAEVGDDVFGEDPTVNRLEAEVASRLGKEAALFTPSGTMANQIAIGLHTRPGDSVLVEEGSHCLAYEAGAAAALWGVQLDTIPHAEHFSDEAIETRHRVDALHVSPTRLVVAENTHNRGGGAVWEPRSLARVAATAHRLGLRTHLDGARLWNAAVASATDERTLAEGFDTVAVCFSKGLGAPVGSALAGSAAAIALARKTRKRLGGGMRQAGVLAAAALHALEHHRSRLAEDHRRAASLAEGLDELAQAGAPLAVRRPERPSNMVYFTLTSGDPAFLEATLGDRGVRVIHLGAGTFRAVTHLDVDDAGIARALETLATLLG